MKIILNVVGFVLIIVSLQACEKEIIESNEIKQKIVFEFERINHAWSEEHFGWLIDSLGNIHCYNLPEQWIECDSLGSISASDLNANFDKTDSICYVIDIKELKSKFLLMENASKGLISDPKDEFVDAGSFSFYGFIFDSEKQIYKRVLLKQIGDFMIENNTVEAKELSNWLLDIQHKIK
ncbi:MAG: hypothetical protein IPH57_14825 [Saprospiraceae bacterium]|nr:hypothetical protein [Saprospiraceae bacterium]